MFIGGVRQLKHVRGAFGDQRILFHGLGGCGRFGDTPKIALHDDGDGEARPQRQGRYGAWGQVAPVTIGGSGEDLSRFPSVQGTGQSPPWEITPGIENKGISQLFRDPRHAPVAERRMLRCGP